MSTLRNFHRFLAVSWISWGISICLLHMVSLNSMVLVFSGVSMTLIFLLHLFLDTSELDLCCVIVGFLGSKFTEKVEMTCLAEYFLSLLFINRTIWLVFFLDFRCVMASAITIIIKIAM